MERIIAVNTNCYHGYSIEEAIEGISAAGYKYIELTATKGWTEHVFPTMSFSKLEKIKELCTLKEIIPIALSGHCNLMDPDRIPDFIDNMRLAHYFECRYIVSSIGEAHLENQVTLTDDEVAERLKDLIPYLTKFKLKLMLEVHGKEHGSGKKIANIIRQINSDLIGINYDTANAIFYGNVDLLEDLAGCIHEVQYLHAKDKAGKIDEWNFPALGEGCIDFAEIKRKLEQSNNDCPFSVEIEFTQAGPSGLQEIHDAVKRSGAYLKSIGCIV